MSLPKKIKRIVFVNGEYLVSDKHGDIYEINQQELDTGSTEIIKSTQLHHIYIEIDPKSSNLAIPKYFNYFKLLDKELLILADDYCKIKVLNTFKYELGYQRKEY